MDGINASLSRQMNKGGGTVLAGKEIRLNEQTMVQHRGKYFMVRKEEPSGDWLELSLVVVDVNTFEVGNGKVELLKYGIANLRKPS